jgi:LytS/YehU family sensor histidine kinase
MVPLVEEIESLERYLTIEKRRFGDDLMVTIRLDPATTGIPVPILLLQPLVENAVQHGLQTTSGQLRLQVSARLDGPRLLLQVANSGSWIETPADKKRRGVGLENIHRRIALLYGDSASLTRTLDPDRVSMTITLPLSPQTHDPLPHR